MGGQDFLQETHFEQMVIENVRRPGWLGPSEGGGHLFITARLSLNHCLSGTHILSFRQVLHSPM
jgi:hypothetical protein